MASAFGVLCVFFVLSLERRREIASTSPSTLVRSKKDVRGADGLRRDFQ
jgi:hypothetical protein